MPLGFSWGPYARRGLKGESGLLTWLGDKPFSCNAGDVGHQGSIPGSGRSPGEGHGSPFQCSCWEMTWREEPGGLQPMGLQRVGHDPAHTHTHTLRGAVHVSRSPELIQSWRFHKWNCRWSRMRARIRTPVWTPHSIRPPKPGGTWAPAPPPTKAAMPSLGTTTRRPWPRLPPRPRASSREGVGRWEGGAVTLTKPPRHPNEDLMHLQ